MRQLDRPIWVRRLGLAAAAADGMRRGVRKGGERIAARRRGACYRAATDGVDTGEARLLAAATPGWGVTQRVFRCASSDLI